jgi:DNA polymerase/3'-5' exonuclease PolX
MSDSPNKILSAHLGEIAQHYQNKKEKYRTIAYKKTSKSILNHPQVITSGEDALKIPGVGKSVLKTIDTFFETGKVDRLEDVNSSEEEVLNLFQTIHGVGLSKAKDLHKGGYRTLADLKNAKMTNAQRVGLLWYDDIKLPIPRSEIDLYKKYFDRVLEGYTWEIAGSYRRGGRTIG